MQRFLALMVFALAAAVFSVQADPADDQYVRIYNSIQDADSLNSQNRYAAALEKYKDAEASLQRLRKMYPDWNPKVLSFRLNYLAGRIAAVSAKAPAQPAPAIVVVTNFNSKTTSAANPAAASGEELNSLQDRIRQLQSDKVLLEAKLKESLSLQPAAADPRDLERAKQRAETLAKENALLKANLDQAKTQPAASAKSAEQARKDLNEANRKLADETKRADALAAEKTSLQNKLKDLNASAYNASKMEATKKALDETDRKLARQKAAADKAASERDELLAKVKTLTAESEAASALRAENQIIKKELADLRAASTSPGNVAENTRRLAEAQAQIASLLSDKEILRLEKVALEQRLEKASALVASLSSRHGEAPSRAEDARRIRELEQDRDTLQKKLELASKELNSRGNRALSARVVEMENQMAMLRARLDVFEARAVPYTPEELALFKHPEIQLASAAPEPGKRSVKELPAGSAQLVADAQRFFQSHDFDKAEQKYIEVLRRDDKNVITLANLAEIQLEQKRFDDAEKHIRQALALAPKDSYSWFVLGQLKFRQSKYDDALDALSRAASLDPQSAEIQNWLGLALSEKGMRGPAETALRKAIQLQPAYADAHANLAVIYVTQTPPLTELARWHYQKALDAGAPHNAFLEARLTEGNAEAAK
ncbi:MAG TPA: tetratricopeptide repeat protein [Verrucomicrobiae bacterium]|nr:tetratricopeptide repeat protein [Verrucomicrobiae bacterium]